jgi:hypothetical protein
MYTSPDRPAPVNPDDPYADELVQLVDGPPEAPADCRPTADGWPDGIIDLADDA